MKLPRIRLIYHDCFQEEPAPLPVPDPVTSERSTTDKISGTGARTGSLVEGLPGRRFNGENLMISTIYITMSVCLFVCLSVCLFVCLFALISEVWDRRIMKFGM